VARARQYAATLTGTSLRRTISGALDTPKLRPSAIRKPTGQSLCGLVLAATAGIPSGYQAVATEEIRHWDASSFGEPVGAVTVGADGRYVAFVGRNEASPYRISHGPYAVFLWDRGKLGDASTPASDAIQVIQDPAGKYVFQTDRDYYRIGMSADGQRLALECSPPQGGMHIALVDLDSTAQERPRVRAVTLASASPKGEPLDGMFAYPSMSRDGRFVVFAGNPREFAVPGQEPFTQVFLYDSNRTAAVELISRGISGEAGNGDSGWLAFYEAAVISADGRLAAFISEATNLVEWHADDEGYDLFVADLESRRPGDLTYGFRLSKAPRVADHAGRRVAMSSPVCISPRGEYVACMASDALAPGHPSVVLVYQVVREASGELTMRRLGDPVAALTPQLSDTFLVGRSGRGIRGIRLGVGEYSLIPESKTMSWLTLAGSQLYGLRLDAGTSLIKADLDRCSQMELTELEKAVLRKLLTGRHPVLKALREQLAACWVSDRDYTGSGFHTDLGAASGSWGRPPGAGQASDRGRSCGDRGLGARSGLRAVHRGRAPGAPRGIHLQRRLAVGDRQVHGPVRR
jgi:hypothetical protein